MAKKVLIVATSNDKLGDTGKPTGCWAEEIIAPILMFKDKGYDVTVASTQGGKIPIDAGSMSDQFRTPEVDKFYQDESLSKILDDSVALPTIQPTGPAYDALYIPGGHGTCWDMPQNAHLQGLVAAHYAQGKVISSVCHGPVGLVNVKLPDGSYLCAGKQVTGFSNSEEQGVGLTEAVPFLLEDRLKEVGGKYTKGDDWSPYAVADSRLVTGQNPQSSKKVAELVIEALG